RINLSENTIKYHFKNILEKLHLRNRAQAVVYAVQSGLLKPKPS
ncbi:MAG: DNA-binding response regulator, partial [Chloroflexi bacterium UTCFX4]